MPSVLRYRTLVLWSVLALAGCAVWQPPVPPLSEAPLELEHTPFFPQEAFHCGPAALATVLGASGVSVHPDDLASALYIPERRGTLQVELVAAARRRGRLAVEIDGTLSAIVRQLEAGRPVLVLQNLAVTFLPRWHYAVVVGYDPGSERFLLRSGGEPRQLTRRGRFDATWRRAGRWGLVVLEPDASPGGLRQEAYLKAAAGLEAAGDHAGALRAFRAALESWPGSPLARLGEANNLYYLGDREAAAAAYRRLLRTHPDDPVALHNLATLLLELDRPCEARALFGPSTLARGELVDAARRAVTAAAPSPCPR